jgi:hypothetical protein
MFGTASAALDWLRGDRLYRAIDNTVVNLIVNANDKGRAWLPGAI